MLLHASGKMLRQGDGPNDLFAATAAERLTRLHFRTASIAEHNRLLTRRASQSNSQGSYRKNPADEDT
jgi:hypothetical protein